MDWRPIETAPKDGTLILLRGEFADGVIPFVARYDDAAEQEPAGQYGRFIWRQPLDGDSIAEGIPTHWSPIPYIPKDLASQ